MTYPICIQRYNQDQEDFHKDDYFSAWYKCTNPKCNHNVSIHPDSNYCPNCGKNIKWLDPIE